jgi:hypothetical protein
MALFLRRLVTIIQMENKSIAIISDAHANLAALVAVLNDIGHITPVVDLGDDIGYGPFPNETLALAKSRAFLRRGGNHEQLVYSRKVKTEILYDPNMMAQEIATWTSERLTPESWKSVDELVQNIQPLEHEGIVFVHSTFKDTIRMNYIDDAGEPSYFYQHFGLSRKVGFVGHSHTPMLIRMNQGNLKCSYIKPEQSAFETGRGVTEFDLSKDESFVACVPSVGMPRDRCSLAGYCLYFPVERRLQFVRLQYDIKSTLDAVSGMEIDPMTRLMLLQKISLGI